MIHQHVCKSTLSDILLTYNRRWHVCHSLKINKQSSSTVPSLFGNRMSHMAWVPVFLDRFEGEEFSPSQKINGVSTKAVKNLCRLFFYKKNRFENEFLVLFLQINRTITDNHDCVVWQEPMLLRPVKSGENCTVDATNKQ